jgi:hypothetical protein
MPAINIPDKTKSALVPIVQSRVPTPDELIVLSKPLLDATIKIGELLQGVPSVWAMGGGVGEIISGVNVNTDHLTILTSAQGCTEISQKLSEFQVEPPRHVEKRLARTAEIDQKHLPIYIKSLAATFTIEGQKLDIHGDLQIRVGEWGWGDPLVFEPDFVHVVQTRVPVIPLRFKSDLYVGLGWADRVQKIHEAMIRSHHTLG